MMEPMLSVTSSRLSFLLFRGTKTHHNVNTLLFLLMLSDLW